MENEEMDRKCGNGKRMRKLRGNEERVRKWSATQNERKKEFHLYIDDDDDISTLQKRLVFEFI